MRIDPFVQQGAKLVGTGAGRDADQGSSVALSANGNTALVGGDTDDHGVGAVWAFTRSGRSRTQQGPKLVGTGTGAGSALGWSVVLSGGGNTAIGGGGGGGGGCGGSSGGVWVFTRSGTTWTQQGSTLSGTGAVGHFVFEGTSVALSSDENTALVGDSDDNCHGNSCVGAVWVFVRR